MYIQDACESPDSITSYLVRQQVLSKKRPRLVGNKFVHCTSTSVIYVNGNENGNIRLRKNFDFVNENGN